MGLTISHLSALDVIRVLRSKAVNLHELDTVPLFPPTPWVGKRWTRQSFDPSIWPWPQPRKTQPLHVLTPKRERRIQAKDITTHTVWQKLPPNTLLWLDQNASIAGPELLFLQMAEVFSLPALVLLGYELCGCFSRTAEEPLEAKVAMDVPAATNVENIIAFLDGFNHVHGLARAREVSVKT